MKVIQLSKIMGIILGIATLSACTTYTGYGTASYGYNGDANYPPSIAPAMITPSMAVVEPSVVEVVHQPVWVNRPTPVIIEDGYRRGFFSRYDDRRNGFQEHRLDQRPDYQQYTGERHRDARQNSLTNASDTATSPQVSTQNTHTRSDWRNRQLSQANTVNGQNTNSSYRGQGNTGYAPQRRMDNRGYERSQAVTSGVATNTGIPTVAK